MRNLLRVAVLTVSLMAGNLMAAEPAQNSAMPVGDKIEIVLRQGLRYTTYDFNNRLFAAIAKHLTDKNLPPYVVVEIVDRDNNNLGQVLIFKPEIVAVTQKTIKEEVNPGNIEMLEKLLGPTMKKENK